MSDKQQKILQMAKDICRYQSCCNDVCKPISACDALRYAERAVEAGYVKQSEGEWIAHEDDWCGTFYTCSACGCDWTTIDGTPQENNMRYCPECGAKMKGADNE